MLRHLTLASHCSNASSLVWIFIDLLVRSVAWRSHWWRHLRPHLLDEGFVQATARLSARLPQERRTGGGPEGPRTRTWPRRGYGR